MTGGRAYGFDSADRRRLADELARHQPLQCPRCAVPLSIQNVDPKPDVPYVRRRIWVVCPQCHGTAALDR